MSSSVSALTAVWSTQVRHMCGVGVTEEAKQCLTEHYSTVVYRLLAIANTRRSADYYRRVRDEHIEYAAAHLDKENPN